MRLTLKRYEAAKKAVKEMRVHEETIKAWEEAIKKVGKMDNQQVVVIEIGDDGEVTFQSKLKDDGTLNPKGSRTDATPVEK